MPAIFIDTNVLVYASDPADPVRQDQALNVLKALETAATGRLSTQCLSEFMHVTTRGDRNFYSPAEALTQVERLLRAFPVFDLTPMIVLEAARAMCDHGLAYYDAQIWAAARLNQVPLIFSEDFSDGQTLEGVCFVDPFSTDFRLEDWA